MNHSDRFMTVSSLASYPY